MQFDLKITFKPNRFVYSFLIFTTTLVIIIGCGIIFSDNTNAEIGDEFTCSNSTYQIISENPNQVSLKQTTSGAVPSYVNNYDIMYKVTAISNNAFKDLNKYNAIKTIYIPETITNMKKQAFNSCNYLQEINVSSDNTVFSSQDGILFTKDKDTLLSYPICKETEIYTVPAITTTIGYMAFYNCEYIKEVKMQDSIKIIDSHAFTGSKIRCVNIPKNVTDLGDHAFFNCVLLDTINFDAINCKDMIAGEQIFDNIGGGWDKATIIFGPTVTRIPAYLLDSSYSQGVGYITIANGVKSIGKHAFDRCLIKEITIPESVVAIEDFAFSNCKDLKNVNLKSNTTSLNWTFYNCESLEQVTISKGVKEITGTFYGCCSLKTIDLPDSITYFGEKTFYGCKITSIAIPIGTTKICDSTFFCCPLESIDIPDTVTYIGKYAFYHTYLSSVQIPSSATTIEKGAFKSSYLTSISIPKNITFIGSEAFAECPLTKIEYNAILCDNLQYDSNIFKNYDDDVDLIIGDGVKQVPSYLTYNSTINSSLRLRNISLSDSITSIGDYAIGACTYVNSLTIPTSIIKIGQHGFFGATFYDSHNNLISSDNDLIGYTFSGSNGIFTATSEPKKNVDTENSSIIFIIGGISAIIIVAVVLLIKRKL